MIMPATPRKSQRQLRGQVACLPCRQKKSKCIMRPESTACLMCCMREINCHFPLSASRQITPTVHTRASSKADENYTVESSSNVDLPVSSGEYPSGTGSSYQITGSDCSLLDEAGDDSPHIIGPTTAQDSDVLEDNLFCIERSMDKEKVRRVASNCAVGPVLFSKVQKRPFGSADNDSYAHTKLEIIERFLGDSIPQLMDLYFQKSNQCFPIIDEPSFRHQYATNKRRVSPAMLSCLLANALVYSREKGNTSFWSNGNDRFVWNLALDALYSELHFRPGISTIAAILLNILGRPATTVIGNGALMGAAVSLAYGLGLNRDPSSWTIPELEKRQRIQIWWCLVTCDRWGSFAFGTPPHIQAAQYNVPAPNHDKDLFPIDDDETSIFSALSTLSNILDESLQYMYRINGPEDQRESTCNFQDSLTHWVESLNGTARRVVLGRSSLEAHGAANLRFTYLATNYILLKVELDGRGVTIPSLKTVDPLFLRTRRSAEDVIIFIQEMDLQQLNGFWLVSSSFALSSIAVFLIRSAVDAELPESGTQGSQSLALVKSLIETLQDYQTWDIGTRCVDLYADIVEKLSSSWPQLPSYVTESLNYSFMDEWIPNYTDLTLFGR